jgi:hypothetical protein
MFTKHRFSHLLPFFHLINNEGPGEPDYNPCVRYQPLVDHANRVQPSLHPLIKKLVLTEAW